MENTKTTKVIFFSLLAIVAIFAIIAAYNHYNSWEFSYSEQPKTFNSTDDLVSFIKTSQSSNRYGGETLMDSMTSAPSVSKSNEVASGASSDFSTTNIQVEGVDEADIVKNDGKYIYSVVGQKVVIVEAYPAENMHILSEINISGVQNIYINGDKLIVLAQEYSSSGSYSESSAKMMATDYYPGYNDYSIQFTKVYIYDVTERSSPKLENNISAEGSYSESRMIGDYIYVLSSKYASVDRPQPPIYILDGVEKVTPATDVYYFDYPDESYVFTSVAAIKISDGDFDSKVYLTGYTGTVYVSQNNIYLTHTKTVSYKDYNDQLVKEVYLKILPADERSKVYEILNSSESSYGKLADIRELVLNYSNSLTGDEKADFDKELSDSLQEFDIQINKAMEKTVVQKIGFDKLDITYESSGEVLGHLLNQFSMDEYEGNFRVATTTGEVWSGNSLNHVFVLDKDLKLVGSLEDIAKGEKIYSARFMGNRLYLVTFKKVDPFFVIDLADPQAPKVLGYLKIPGYSDYLHIYDENHVIGIGKEAVDASEAEVSGRSLDFAWYQGVKIAVFDVTDVEHPKENAKFVIGDRGTDSLALQEHKAFLFNKDKNLLVIPINLALIDESKYRTCSDEEASDYRNYDHCLTANTYGEQVWQGAYVLNINTSEISLRGRVTHNENETQTDYYYGYNYNNQILRSLYIGDSLYTISNSMIKANNLETVEEISSVKLPAIKQDYYPIYY